MQKIILSFAISWGVCCGAYGATACLHNRTAVFTIKKSENPTSVSSNASDMTFSLSFGYDLVPNNGVHTLRGAATCNEITTNSSNSTASMGDVNVYLRSSSVDVGTRCWCSFAGPITSWWVYYRAYADEDTCQSSCARDCANAIKSNTNNFRTNGMYLAIW